MLEREDSDLIKGGVLEDLRRAGEHCDVSLYTKDGNVLEAHKVILSLHSPVFRRMLNTNSSMRPLLYMRGVSTEIMTSIINFIYTGSIDIKQDNVDEFFEVGGDLNIDGLARFTIKKNKKEDEKEDVNQNNPHPFSGAEQYRNLVAENSDTKLEDINFASADKDEDLACTEFNTARNSEKEDNIQYNSKTMKEMQESENQSDGKNNNTFDGDGDTLILINDDEVTMPDIIKTMNQNFHRNKIENVFQCNHCSQNETSKSRIKEHVSKHINGITFHCLACKKQISDFTTFIKHMKNEHRHIVHTY